MENPFEVIIERLDRIENALNQILNSDKNDNVPIKDHLMNVQEVADYLSLSIATIYGKCHFNEIPRIKKGKRLYFLKSDIDSWLAESKQKTNDDIQKMALDYINKNPLHRRR